MLKILSFNGTPAEYFDDFDELFDCITTIENLKLVAKCPDTEHLSWSFTIYQPRRVAALCIPKRNAHPTIFEAFDENLPLIEICIGDYKKPQYIVLTPNVDLNHLKQKWCIDYCTFHHLLIREV